MALRADVPDQTIQRNTSKTSEFRCLQNIFCIPGQTRCLRQTRSLFFPGDLLFINYQNKIITFCFKATGLNHTSAVPKIKRSFVMVFVSTAFFPKSTTNRQKHNMVYAKPSCSAEQMTKQFSWWCVCSVMDLHPLSRVPYTMSTLNDVYPTPRVLYSTSTLHHMYAIPLVPCTTSTLYHEYPVPQVPYTMHSFIPSNGSPLGLILLLKLSPEIS